MSWFIRKVKLPPYFGVPRVAHQFPVEVVVVEAVTTAVVDMVVAVDEVVIAVVDNGLDVWVDVGAGVWVDVAHDAKTSDVAMIKINIIQIVFLFI